MEYVFTEKAPKVVGPYSQAVKSNDLIFCSGQIGINPSTGSLVEGIVEQTTQVLSNLENVLKKAGSGKHKVLKTTVYLANMVDYQAMNEVYAKFFGETRPARAAVQVAQLPLNALVEIDCIATK